MYDSRAAYIDMVQACLCQASCMHRHVQSALLPTYLAQCAAPLHTAQVFSACTCASSLGMRQALPGPLACLLHRICHCAAAKPYRRPAVVGCWTPSSSCRKVNTTSTAQLRALRACQRLHRWCAAAPAAATAIAQQQHYHCSDQADAAHSEGVLFATALAGSGCRPVDMQGRVTSCPLNQLLYRAEKTVLTVPAADADACGAGGWKQLQTLQQLQQVL